MDNKRALNTLPKLRGDLSPVGEHSSAAEAAARAVVDVLEKQM